MTVTNTMSEDQAFEAYSRYAVPGPGRSHFIIGQKGWEEVADYALRWAVEHAAAPATA